MANSSIVVRSSFLALLSSLLLFVVVPSHAGPTNDVVSTICTKTRNPGFCASVLKSAGSQDLKSLATYTLNLAHTNAAQSLSLARSLAAKTANPQLKQRYSACSANYDDAVGDVEQAQKYLASGDYNGVNVEASAVMTEVDECDGNFKQLPADASLSKNGKTLEDICSIILVISNLLPKPM